MLSRGTYAYPGAYDGRPPGDCRAHGLVRGDQARWDRDATATRGDAASRDPSCGGHRCLPPWVVTPAPPLPVHLGSAPGPVTDCTMGPTSLDRFLKTGAAHA
jgi:hypothetical protein